MPPSSSGISNDPVPTSARHRITSAKIPPKNSEAPIQSMAIDGCDEIEFPAGCQKSDVQNGNFHGDIKPIRNDRPPFPRRETPLHGQSRTSPVGIIDQPSSRCPTNNPFVIRRNKRSASVDGMRLHADHPPLRLARRVPCFSVHYTACIA